MISVGLPSDTGVDQTMIARTPDEDGGSAHARTSRKRDRSSSLRDSAEGPGNADEQLEEEFRNHPAKTERRMKEAAEQYDEARSLQCECASMESTIQTLRTNEAGGIRSTDEAGGIQRITGLERITPLRRKWLRFTRMKDG